MLEDAGYRREQIKSLSRWYVLRVLQHRRDEKGKLDLKAAMSKVAGAAAKRRLSREEQLTTLLKRRRCPQHMIAVRIEEMIRAADAKLSFGGPAAIRGQQSRGGKGERGAEAVTEMGETPSLQPSSSPSSSQPPSARSIKERATITADRIRAIRRGQAGNSSEG